MPAFRFRLQSVLDYRASLVDRARLELAALQARLHEAEDTLAALRRAEQDALHELAAAQAAKRLDLAEVTRLLEYVDALAEQIAAQRQVVERRRQEADDQQQRVLELAQAARVLEKLRDRQLEEYLQEDARRERAETSEIAAQRHQRLQVTRP